MIRRAGLLLVFLICLPSMARALITFEGRVTAQGNGHLGTLTLPSTVQANDLVLVQVSIRDIAGSDNIVAPTGWVQIGGRLSTRNRLHVSTFYRVATASDASRAFTFDFDGNGNRRYVIGGSVFRGVQTANPIVRSSTRTVGRSTSINAPSLNANAANSMLVGLYSVGNGDMTMTPPSSMTEIYDVEEDNTANGVAQMAAYELLTRTGGTGARIAQVSARFDGGTGVLVALREGAAPPRISAVDGVCANLRRVVVTFDQNVTNASARNRANYQVTAPSGATIAITNAVRSPNNVVTLTLASNLLDLTQYRVTINNVVGTNGLTIPTGTTATFALACGLNCFTDNFAGPGSLGSSWSVGSSSGSFGSPRIVNNGRMQLTDRSGSVATVANLLMQFPGAANRIVVEFDYYAYNGSGADGVAVTFSDATVTPRPGGYGGSLGYAQRTGIPGFAGGWLGVGIDEYGNFSNPTEGRQPYAGPGSAPNQGRRIDSVSIRGSGSGTTGYRYLAGTATLSPGVDQGGSTPAPGHRYRISLDHTAGGGVAMVSVERNTGTGYVTLIPAFNVFSANPSQAAVPANWLLSFTGSTGGSTNIHELANLRVCTAQPMTPLNSVDHYHISHSGSGVTCEAEPVTVTAHDINHNAVNVLNNTSLTISASPAVTNISPNPVVIPAGSSSAVFYVQQTTPLSVIDLDVRDSSGRTDLDGVADHDPSLSFAATGLRFYADGNHNSIEHQLSGKSSDTGYQAQTLTLRAVLTNTDTGACEARVTGTQNVGIGFECQNPFACGSALDFAGRSVAGSNAGSGAITYTNVPLSFDATGSATFSMLYNQSGLLQLFARLALPATPPDPAIDLVGYSNPFAVRPFGFDIDFPSLRAADFADDGALNGSAGNTSWAANSSGSPFQAAGTGFATRVRAVRWQASDDVDEDGIPDPGANLGDNAVVTNFANQTSPQGFQLRHALVAPAAGVSGTLNNATVASSAFASGILNLTPSYSEVGIIDLTAELDGYLGIGGLNIRGNAPNVGRFYPASFNVAVNPGTFANACAGASPFTYIGQPFSYGAVPTLDISALNALGAVTQNYTTSAFQRLTASGVGVLFPNADSTQLGRDGSTLMSLTFTPDSLTLPALSVSAPGVMRYAFAPNDVFSYAKNLNSAVAPFVSDLAIRLTSLSDGEASAPALPLVQPSPITLRYGRWMMQNAFGPEIMTLRMPAETQYLTAAGTYVTNSADGCTALPLLSSSSGTPAPGRIDNIVVGGGNSNFSYNATLSGGLAAFTFTPPGSGNTGSIPLSVDLSGLPWLQFDWDGDGSLDAHPPVNATFGLYRGHDRIIFWREVEN